MSSLEVALYYSNYMLTCTIPMTSLHDSKVMPSVSEDTCISATDSAPTTRLGQHRGYISSLVVDEDAEMGMHGWEGTSYEFCLNCGLLFFLEVFVYGFCRIIQKWALIGHWRSKFHCLLSRWRGQGKAPSPSPSILFPCGWICILLSHVC